MEGLAGADMSVDPEVAWRALKASRRRLDRSRYRRIPGRMPAKQPCRTGCSPREATARLVAGGVSADRVAAAMEEALRSHAAEVVSSWEQWVERHGFLDEMSALPDEERRELASRERWDELSRQVATATLDPGRLVSEPDLLRDLSARATRLNRRDASHPAVYVLTRLHDLPAGLAEAAVLCSARVPLWSLAALALLVAACAVVSAVALARLVSGDWDSIPLLLACASFGAFFAFAFVHLWRERPRREQAWRGRVAAWVGESPGSATETSGGAADRRLC